MRHWAWVSYIQHIIDHLKISVQNSFHNPLLSTRWLQAKYVIVSIYQPNIHSWPVLYDHLAIARVFQCFVWCTLRNALLPICTYIPANNEGILWGDSTYAVMARAHVHCAHIWIYCKESYEEMVLDCFRSFLKDLSASALTLQLICLLWHILAYRKYDSGARSGTGFGIVSCFYSATNSGWHQCQDTCQVTFASFRNGSDTEPMSNPHHTNRHCLM